MENIKEILQQIADKAKDIQDPDVFDIMVLANDALRTLAAPPSQREDAEKVLAYYKHDNSTQVNFEDAGSSLEVNCFDEESEMVIVMNTDNMEISIALSIDQTKKLSNFLISHIKNESEANPQL